MELIVALIILAILAAILSLPIILIYNCQNSPFISDGKKVGIIALTILGSFAWGIGWLIAIIWAVIECSSDYSVKMKRE